MNIISIHVTFKSLLIPRCYHNTLLHFIIRRNIQIYKQFKNQTGGIPVVGDRATLWCLLHRHNQSMKRCLVTGDPSSIFIQAKNAEKHLFSCASGFRRTYLNLVYEHSFVGTYLILSIQALQGYF